MKNFMIIPYLIPGSNTFDPMIPKKKLTHQKNSTKYGIKTFPYLVEYILNVTDSFLY